MPLCGHYDFQVRPAWYPSFFILLAGQKSSFLYLCHGLHLLVSYSKDELFPPAGMWKKKDVSIPLNSVFIGLDNLPHPRAE